MTDNYSLNGGFSLAHGIVKDYVDIDFKSSSFTAEYTKDLSTINSELINNIIPTQPISDNSLNIATTAYVKNNLENYLTDSLAKSKYAPKISPNFTGTPTISTSINISDSSNKIATTEYFQTKLLTYPAKPTVNFSPEDLVSYLPKSVADTTYAPLISPNLTGTPKAVTKISSDSSNSIATIGYVTNKLSQYVTSNFLDETYITKTNSGYFLTKTEANTTYAPKISPNLSGTPRVNVTIPVTDNSDKIATTTYVKNKLSEYLTTISANETYAELSSLSGLSTYLTKALAFTTYLPKDNPILTGNPTLNTTIPVTDNSNKIVTNEYVTNNLSEENYIPQVINVNNTTETNLNLIFSSGTGNLILKNNSNLKYDASNGLLLINESYYLNGCPEFTITLSNASPTHTLTPPLYPYYTFSASGFTNQIYFNLPIPSANYLGFKINIRKIAGSGPAVNLNFKTETLTDTYMINHGANVLSPTNSVILGLVHQSVVFEAVCLMKIDSTTNTTNYYWYCFKPITGGF